MNRILSLDVERRRVRVQPGVVRNELNRFLAPHGLFFGPETSTAGWAMIGGMVGNNSCGSNSIAYGTTRDHLISARGFLADGSEATFGPLDAADFRVACDADNSLAATIYRELHTLLSDPATRQLVRNSFPRPEVTRRNTGYALDALMDASCFDPASTADFNACRILAGSEGTLFMGVEFELNILPLPPPGALLCVHCDTVDESLRATVVVMRDLASRGIRPTGCELIDKKILDCTKNNLEQARNRACRRTSRRRSRPAHPRSRHGRGCLESRRPWLRLSAAHGRRGRPRLGVAAGRPGACEQPAGRCEAPRNRGRHGRRGRRSAGLHRRV
jgi:FAD/FMN-containing dehydrogenase